MNEEYWTITLKQTGYRKLSKRREATKHRLNSIFFCLGKAKMKALRNSSGIHVRQWVYLPHVNGCLG